MKQINRLASRHWALVATTLFGVLREQRKGKLCYRNSAAKLRNGLKILSNGRVRSVVANLYREYSGITTSFKYLPTEFYPVWRK